MAKMSIAPIRSLLHLAEPFSDIEKKIKPTLKNVKNELAEKAKRRENFDFNSQLIQLENLSEIVANEFSFFAGIIFSGDEFYTKIL
jgi:hypothetical protein